MEKLKVHEAGFRSLIEHIDTTTPAGIMLSQMLGSFAEFERAMIRQRTKAGLESARKQGRIGGRPSKLTKAQKTEILQMITSGQKSAADAARLFGVHRATVARLMYATVNQ